MNRYDRCYPSAKHTLDETQVLSEAQGNQVDYILKIGLASNLDKLTYYRRIIADPKKLISDPILRPFAAEILTKLLGILFSDTVVWNRTKTIFTRNKKSVKSLREEISDSGLRALIEKASESEVPLETILEVYSRGAAQGGESIGFNRVNSFLSGGKALELDRDLLGLEPIQEEKKNDKTLSVLKRVLKEKMK